MYQVNEYTKSGILCGFVSKVIRAEDSSPGSNPTTAGYKVIHNGDSGSQATKKGVCHLVIEPSWLGVKDPNSCKPKALRLVPGTVQIVSRLQAEIHLAYGII